MYENLEWQLLAGMFFTMLPGFFGLYLAYKIGMGQEGTYYE